MEIRTQILLKEEYEYLINEELSVSEHVISVTQEIEKHLKNHWYLDFHLNNFDFVGKLEIEINRVKSDGGGSSSILDSTNVSLDNNGLIIGCKLNINVSISENNESDIDYLYASIFHEIEHLFQIYQKLKNDKYTQPKSSFSSKEYKNKYSLYDLAQLTLQNGDIENIYISLLSWLFYLNEYEQDATASELYNIMLKKDYRSDFEFDMFYKQSQTYKKLLKLKDAYKLFNNINQNDLGYKEMIQWLYQNNVTFNLQRTQQLIDYNIKRFESKIGKVLTKIKLDKGMMGESDRGKMIETNIRIYSDKEIEQQKRSHDLMKKLIREEYNTY